MTIDQGCDLLASRVPSPLVPSLQTPEQNRHRGMRWLQLKRAALNIETEHSRAIPHASARHLAMK
jgi:hypothetical protein